ncbi:hypothetical protein TNCV_4459861 [Trichonephila clavipes]|nr:hypothetical protein TNCV_4459861 [Trichonephila clavipes]
MSAINKLLPDSVSECKLKAWEWLNCSRVRTLTMQQAESPFEKVVVGYEGWHILRSPFGVFLLKIGEKNNILQSLVKACGQTTDAIYPPTLTCHDEFRGP